MSEVMSFAKSYARMLDYLLQFGMAKCSVETVDQEYPRTHGGLIGFAPTEPMEGDLVLLSSAPMSEWRLSWYVEKRRQKGWLEDEYLLQSASTGELCWWHNVGLNVLCRKTTQQHPEWRWDDEQVEFNSNWIKWMDDQADGYIYRPMYCSFYAGEEVEFSVRVRHSDRHVSKRFPKWKSITKKQQLQIYKDLVAELQQVKL